MLKLSNLIKTIMKKITLFLFLLAVYSLTCGSVTAQKSSEKIKAEIMETLKQWNNAGKNANLDQIMALYDNTDNIFMAGSDSGEIFKGKDQIKGWLALLLKNNSFSWEMNRIDIDYISQHR